MIQWKSLLIDLNNISLFHISFSEKNRNKIKKKIKNQKRKKKLFKEAVTRQYQVPSVNCFVIELSTVVSFIEFESYSKKKREKKRRSQKKEENRQREEKGERERENQRERERKIHQHFLSK